MRTYIVYTIRNTSISFLRKKAVESRRLVSIDDQQETERTSDDALLPEKVIIMDEKKKEFRRAHPETRPA